MNRALFTAEKEMPDPVSLSLFYVRFLKEE